MQQILAEARQLPRAEMHQLFDHLLVETFAQPDAEFGAAWREETLRRIGQIERGEVQGLPAAEVMAELRAIVGR